MATKARSFTITAETTASTDHVFALIADATTWTTWTPIRSVERANLAPDGCVITWYEGFTPAIAGTGAFFAWFLHTFIAKCMDGLVKKAEA